MSSYFEACKDLLFPPHCLGCQRRLPSSRPPLFCTDCSRGIEVLSPPWCRCCGLPFAHGADHLCGTCLQQTYSFDLARSLCAYQPPVSSLVLALKFSQTLNGLASISALVEQTSFSGHFSKPDLVLPVPLHPARLKQRGFNQALVIAQTCFPQWWQRNSTGILIRRHNTLPQSLLTGAKRRVNLKQAFAIRDPLAVQGKRILLVDDVLTTGSTVNACAEVLLAAGACRIEVFTVARSLARRELSPVFRKQDQIG